MTENEFDRGKEADPTSVTPIDPLDVIRQVQENGFYVLPKDTNVFLSVQTRYRRNTPAQYHHLGVVPVYRDLPVLTDRLRSKAHGADMPFDIRFSPYYQPLTTVFDRLTRRGEELGNPAITQIEDDATAFFAREFLRRQPYSRIAWEKGINLAQAQQMRFQTNFIRGATLTPAQVPKLFFKRG